MDEKNISCAHPKPKKATAFRLLPNLALSGRTVSRSRKHSDKDDLDPLSHLGRQFTPAESEEHGLTSASVSNEIDNFLARWDFSRARFLHLGTAHPARGILTQSVKSDHPDLGNLRFNVFGKSKLLLPF